MQPISNKRKKRIYRSRHKNVRVGKAAGQRIPFDPVVHFHDDDSGTFSVIIGSLYSS